jgi:hypothetical protein
MASAAIPHVIDNPAFSAPAVELKALHAAAGSVKTGCGEGFAFA